MLQGISYVPTLHTKVAEIKAFSRLAPSVRNGLFPIFVARPWQNANDLATSWNNITACVDNIRYGIDLDRFKYRRSGRDPAASDFDSLFDHTDGFGRYFQTLRHMVGAIPVLRSVNGEFLFLDSQLDRTLELDRGLIVRIEIGHSHDIEETIDRVTSRIEDPLFVVDAGWCQNLLIREHHFSRVIQIISDRTQDGEIVVSASTFPRSFGDLGNRGVTSIEERELCGRLVRRHNDANLIYGDWGSTRSSVEPTPMKAIPRIDLAGTGDWTSFRRRETEPSYPAIARRVLVDAAWSNVPNCWAKDAIELTAVDESGGISGTQLATEVRVNMHLTAQVSYASDPRTDEDTPYVDPF